MKTIAEWFEKNKQWLITLAVIAILDEFFLRGRLRDRISGLLSGILDRLEQPKEKRLEP